MPLHLDALCSSCQGVKKIPKSNVKFRPDVLAIDKVHRSQLGSIRSEGKYFPIKARQNGIKPSIILKRERTVTKYSIVTIQMMYSKTVKRFKIVYSCCFSIRVNQDFLDFIEKKFYNIDYS